MIFISDTKMDWNYRSVQVHPQVWRGTKLRVDSDGPMVSISESSSKLLLWKNSLCFQRIYLFLKFSFIIIRHIDLNWLKHDSIWSLILSWILILHVFYGLENEVRYKAIYFAFRSQINLILYIFLYILYYMMKLCIKMHLLRNYNF